MNRKRPRTVRRAAIAGLAVLIACAAAPARAAVLGWTSNEDGRYVLGKDVLVEDNFYAAGQEVTLFGNVAADAAVAAFGASVPGTVAEDLLIAGVEVSVPGAVGGDVRIGAAAASIEGSILGELSVIAGEASIDSDAFVSGDVLMLVGDARIDGSVGGDAKIAAEAVSVNGYIGGDLKVFATEISIGPNARIAGDIVWSGEHAPAIDPKAVILGEARRSTSFLPVGKDGSFASTLAFSLFGALSSALTLLLLALVAPRTLSPFFALSLQGRHFARGVLYGVGVMFGAPLFIGLAIATVLGIPVAIMAGMAFGGILAFAYVAAGMPVGIALRRAMAKDIVPPSPYSRRTLIESALLGTFVLHLVALVPIIGPIAFLACFLAAAGIAGAGLIRSVRQPREVVL